MRQVCAVVVCLLFILLELCCRVESSRAAAVVREDSSKSAEEKTQQTHFSQRVLREMQEYMLVKEQIVQEMIRKVQGLSTVSKWSVDDLIYKIKVVQEDMKNRKKEEENTFQYEQSQSDIIKQKFENQIQTLQEQLILLELKQQQHFKKKTEMLNASHSLLDKYQIAWQYIFQSWDCANPKSVEAIETAVAIGQQKEYIFETLRIMNLVTDADVEEFIFEEMLQLRQQVWRSKTVNELLQPVFQVIEHSFELDQEIAQRVQKIYAQGELVEEQVIKFNHEIMLSIQRQLPLRDSMSQLKTQIEQELYATASFVQLYTELIASKREEMVFYQDQIQLHEKIVKKDKQIMRKLEEIYENEIRVLEQVRKELLRELPPEEAKRIEQTSLLLENEWGETPTTKDNKL